MASRVRGINLVLKPLKTIVSLNVNSRVQLFQPSLGLISTSFLLTLVFKGFSTGLISPCDPRSHGALCKETVSLPLARMCNTVALILQLPPTSVTFLPYLMYFLWELEPAWSLAVPCSWGPTRAKQLSTAAITFKLTLFPCNICISNRSF